MMNRFILVILLIFLCALIYSESSLEQINPETQNTNIYADSISGKTNQDSQAKTKSVSPVSITILGMITVFAGLVIMQVFINVLKLVLNPPPKAKKEVTKEEEVNKGLLSKVELTEDEMVATITAVMMESKLHHTVSHDKITIKWQDNGPHWISTRRF